MVQAASAEAQQARSQFSQFRQAIDERVREIEEGIDGPLAEAYERATAALEQAGAKARSAQNHDRQGEFANAAGLPLKREWMTASCATLTIR